MRILSVYYTHKPGGFCKRLYRLLSALVARGHLVTYCSLDLPPSTLSGDVKFQRIPFPLRNRSGVFFWAIFTAWVPMYIAWTVLRHKPERIVVFGAYYSAVCQPSRFIFGTKLVLFLRSLAFKIDQITGKHPLLRFLSSKLEYFGIKGSDIVVCMTKVMQQDVEEFIAASLKHSSVLPNDVESVSNAEHFNSMLPAEALSRIAEVNKNQGLIAFTSGVLDARKNVGHLINVFAELEKIGLDPRILLLVAGSGPIENKLLDQSKGLRSVQFLGWQQSLLPWLKLKPIVLHAATHEGMPNSVLEALGEGCIVLASDIPELREMMGSNELLFSLESTECLKIRLKRILENPEFKSELLSKSHDAAMKLKFDWNARACEIVES